MKTTANPGQGAAAPGQTGRPVGVGAGPAPASASGPPADLAAIRAKLTGVRGQHYWRSLEELAETPEFQQMLHREFPPGAAEWWDGLSRRNFLKMAAASLALAGLTACTKQPTEEIYPYVKQPEELVLGQPLFYASSMVLGGFATGVLAKSREGHPIKIDGNPDHPAARGGSSIWMQASILDLYDPDRSQSVTHNGELSDWALFLSDLNDLLREHQAKGGEGLRFLTETVTSPTLAGQLEQLLQRFPQAEWHQYDPIARDNVREGARLAFGEVVEAHYDFEQAKVIVSLDSDFLYIHPARLRNTLGFTNGRRLSAGRREMNRLYVLESTPTVTGTVADHRLPVSSGAIDGLARWLARRLGVSVREGATAVSGTQIDWLEAVARELQQHPGASIVLAGEWQPPPVHALAHALNEHLGNVGKTVRYTESAEARPIQQLESLRELAADLRAGAVETLFILGGNPVYTAPADLEFGRLLSRVPRSIHVGLQWDETAALCSWHIPQTHYLESWGDARSVEGTVSLQQPLIAPLYSGKSLSEVLGAMRQQQPVRSDYEILREFWQSQKRWPDFDQGWRQALHDGFIEGTRAEERKVRLNRNWEQPANTRFDPAGAASGAEESPSNQRSGQGGSGDASEGAHAASGSGVAPKAFGVAADKNVRAPGPGETMVETSTPPSTVADKRSPFSISPPKEVEIQNLEICFRPDPNLWDGRFANNGWLQECPRPVNKLTWDNAVLVSPALAERSGLRTNDVVEVNFRGQKVRGPVWVMPGQADNSITLHLGYGRSRVGRVGAGVGFNAYRLRMAETLWTGMGASLVKTGKKHALVATQTHHDLGSPERQVYRAATLEAFLAHPDSIKKSVESPETGETLYYPDEYKYEGYKWGMSIDLTTCIGCNACILGCNIENNIPVVGKDQVSRGREMLWLRVDTYLKGGLDNPEFSHMPVPCMHCEHAPCELVCPVEATVHDHEGLNVQVYNRCVGTRFCSNNCPYKVRRFNFYRYSPYDKPYLKPMYNPEVTVRWRGVMEKCTYCIQRIASARIAAEKKNRHIRDNEVKTACQQACPANAIIFGDLNDPNSKVSKLKQQPLDYEMLGQLNTRPRTTYLAKVENRNKDIENQRPES